MDSAILSTASGLVGSLIGAASSIVATWLAQHGQLRAQSLVQEATKREALYAEFIVEASKRLTHASSHQAEGPEVIAGLYAAVKRMHLISSRDVIRTADEVVRVVVETYASPNITFEEVRERMRGGETRDPLKEFTKACKAELDVLRG